MSFAFDVGVAFVMISALVVVVLLVGIPAAVITFLHALLIPRKTHTCTLMPRDEAQAVLPAQDIAR